MLVRAVKRLAREPMGAGRRSMSGAVEWDPDLAKFGPQHGASAIAGMRDLLRTLNVSEEGLECNENVVRSVLTAAFEPGRGIVNAEDTRSFPYFANELQGNFATIASHSMAGDWSTTLVSRKGEGKSLILSVLALAWQLQTGRSADPGTLIPNFPIVLTLDTDWFETTTLGNAAAYVLARNIQTLLDVGFWDGDQQKKTELAALVRTIARKVPQSGGNSDGILLLSEASEVLGRDVTVCVDEAQRYFNADLSEFEDIVDLNDDFLLAAISSRRGFRALLTGSCNGLAIALKGGLNYPEFAGKKQVKRYDGSKITERQVWVSTALRGNGHAIVSRFSGEALARVLGEEAVGMSVEDMRVLVAEMLDAAYGYDARWAVEFADLPLRDWGTFLPLPVSVGVAPIGANVAYEQLMHAFFNKNKSLFAAAGAKVHPDSDVGEFVLAIARYAVKTGKTGGRLAELVTPLTSKEVDDTLQEVRRYGQVPNFNPDQVRNALLFARALVHVNNVYFPCNLVAMRQDSPSPQMVMDEALRSVMRPGDTKYAAAKRLEGQKAAEANEETLKAQLKAVEANVARLKAEQNAAEVQATWAVRSGIIGAVLGLASSPIINHHFPHVLEYMSTIIPWAQTHLQTLPAPTTPPSLGPLSGAEEPPRA
jgi:hypothetical protein